MSESLLVTATAPTATSKVKTLELCNPTLAVELKYTGTLSFKWTFKWEECVDFTPFALKLLNFFFVRTIDTNLSGSEKNAILFESQILPFWLR